LLGISLTFNHTLKQLGWKESELKKRRKGDKGKEAQAQRLRQQTTMSLKSIAQRLEMGSWSYVSNLLRAKTNPKIVMTNTCTWNLSPWVFKSFSSIVRHPSYHVTL
jgi:hypothetical protein